MKKQSSTVSRFKNVGVGREDFEYLNPTTNTGSTRRRQQQYDQALNIIFRDINQYLLKMDYHAYFHNKVTNKDAPNYSVIVQKPICLKDMLNKTKQNAYKSSEEFLGELKLMHANAAKYNGEVSPITQIAASLVAEASKLLGEKSDEIVNLETLLRENVLQV